MWRKGQHWHVTHGSASIAIEAGRLADLRKPGHWQTPQVPAGSKARLLFAYINDFAIRHNTPVIDLGKSHVRSWKRIEFQLADPTAMN